jgi:hypothetical protein
MIQKLNSASRDYETITVNLMTSPPPGAMNKTLNFKPCCDDC